MIAKNHPDQDVCLEQRQDSSSGPFYTGYILISTLFFFLLLNLKGEYMPLRHPFLRVIRPLLAGPFLPPHPHAHFGPIICFGFIWVLTIVWKCLPMQGPSVVSRPSSPAWHTVGLHTALLAGYNGSLPLAISGSDLTCRALLSPTVC